MRIGGYCWVVLIGLVLSDCKGASTSPNSGRGTQPQEYGTLLPQPACDLRFHAQQDPQQMRWRGADNGQTAKLSNGKVVWIFSDTWVGFLQGTKRYNARIIRNSVAIQEQARCDTPVQFFWRTTATQQPESFFVPNQGEKEGFFWPHSLYVYHDQLLVMHQWLKVNPKPQNIFEGAIPLGNVLTVVENPTDSPEQWRYTQHHFADAGKPVINYSLQMFEDPTVPGFLLLLGSEEKGGGRTAISLHRFRWNKQTKLVDGIQTYQSDGTWGTGLTSSRQILWKGASQSHIFFDHKHKRYVGLYARGWEGIWLRTSPQLTKTWSQETLLFRFPELARSPHVFCGTLGVHPVMQSPENTVLLTYICNSTDFWAMAADITLYVPKFLRLTWK